MNSMQMKCSMLAAMLLCGAVIPMSAQQEYALSVVKTDGTSTLYRLSEEPELKMGGSDFTITTPNVTFTYSEAEVSHFTFEEVEPDAIGGIAADSDVRIALEGDALVVELAEGGKTVEVFAVNGQKVKTAQAQRGRTTLSLSSLPAGIYIVKAGERQTVKIVKK